MRSAAALEIRLILLQRPYDDHPDGGVVMLNELLKGAIPGFTPSIRTVLTCDSCLVDVPKWRRQWRHAAQTKLAVASLKNPGSDDLQRDGHR